MAAKKRIKSLVENNTDSPFKILDVRSINDDVSKHCFDVLQQTEAALSDDSSGSEKELVIDMADMEEESQSGEENSTSDPLEVLVLETEAGSPQPKAKSPAQVKPATSVRTYRRKNQHVFKRDELSAPGEPAEQSNESTEMNSTEESLRSNHNIMKHIALVRTAINHVMEKYYETSFSFPAHTNDFETMDAWIQAYKQIKQDAAAAKDSQANLAKK
ncbi:uncharacterized protein LOC128723830 [Anopheles nili]|uniref:uncharacterized protein LOC128723830 n=1 Tax=Anopheles nili TaxID=185578 RepID=UPI00237C14D9|nr:uncharacterized protein LOC128723830 [Anopheles nili]